MTEAATVPLTVSGATANAMDGVFGDVVL